jgi:hypothetical protein
MDKRMNKKVMNNLILITACALLCVPSFAADDGYALLVQQSPPGGGSINLGTGVHKMGIGQTVTLSAITKSGYRFLYWLGDVSSADAAETSIQIDSPKMVVAVFAPDEFDEDPPSAGGGAATEPRSMSGAYGGGSSGQRSYNPIQSAASVSGTYDYGSSSVGGYIPYVPPSQEDPTDYIPVPEGEEVPEPATLALLGIGSAVLLRRKRK